MKISYDPAKNAKNISERGLSFERAVDFDFGSATFLTDERRDYGELRQIAIGYLDDRLHYLCFTETSEGIRVISFRKANAREARKHGKALTIH
ncbi:MAG: BrnT family toxin [Halothiobacillaceae bacterium]|nr:BrnT family toxin [Halothiobacillaceae bacterium]